MTTTDTDGTAIDHDASDEDMSVVEMEEAGMSWQDIAEELAISIDEALGLYRAEVYEHWDTGWELGPTDAQSRFETGGIDVWGDGEATVQIEELHEDVPLTLIAEGSETRTLVQANLSADEAATLADTLNECAEILRGEK